MPLVLLILFILYCKLLTMLYRLIIKNNIYILLLTIFPILLIALFIFDYNKLKYPVFEITLLIPVFISFIPITLSLVFWNNKDKKALNIIYKILFYISTLLASLVVVLGAFSGFFNRSYTTNIDNYLQVDEEVLKMDPYDVSYFPKIKDNLKVLEYKYEYIDGPFDSKYDIELKVKYEKEEFEKELERIKALENFKLINESNFKFIKDGNSCKSDCFLNYVGFDIENNIVLYTVTHREGDTFRIPYYYKNE